MAKPIRIFAAIGDFEYSYSRTTDGVERCERALKNAPGQPPEELTDFQQLPEQVKALISSAQSLAAG